MDALGQTELVDTSLQPSLQEVLHLERKHVIELHAGFIKHTHTDETANQGVSLEKSLWIFLFHGQKLTVRRVLGQHVRRAKGVANSGLPSSTTNLGEGEHNAPHLALVTKTIFTDDLEFRVPATGVNSFPST